MCGIVAISTHEHTRFSVEKCLIAIMHRGPDGQGTFISNNLDCQLGHVRLSIFDLSPSGQQPMSDATGRYTIVYNGEVYNYLELKKTLDSKYGTIQWRSATDTEVIIEGFAREGVDFLENLNGFFSLVIYDAHALKMYVLRDPLGIKPLFVTQQNGSAYFSSELKGITALSHLKRSLRVSSLADQLAFMYIPEPHTIYHEYCKVKPGICYIYRFGKLINEVKLFDFLREDLLRESFDDSVNRLRDAFTNAMKRQVRSDVPLSLMLSGGLDSAAVAYSAVSTGAKIDSAYTIAFSDTAQKSTEQNSDLYYAELMAKKLDLQLAVIRPESFILSNTVPSVIKFMEDGFTDPAAINTYLLCSAAHHDGIKVMLSGQGSDEFLGGYRRYSVERIINKWPQFLIRGVGKVGFGASVFSHFLSEDVTRRLRRFYRFSEMNATDRLFNLFTWTESSLISKMFCEEIQWSGKQNFTAAINSFSNYDIADAMMFVDREYDLTSLNLCYTDRMSMAVGVECRVPFLDFEFVKTANSIPIDFKIKGMKGKAVFRKAMENYLPREIVNRSKAGFGMPISLLLNVIDLYKSHYLNPVRISSQGIFNASIIERLIQVNNNNRELHIYTIFTLLCQQMWMEHVGI